MLIRKNVIRDVQTPEGVAPVYGSELYGVSLERCGELIAENNVIENVPTDQSVYLKNCPQFKAFNNQSAGGQLLRAFNFNTGRRVLELEDEVQDVLLPV